MVSKSRLVSVAGFAVILGTALVAFGGAAALPDGVLIGEPTRAAAVAVAAVVTLAALVAGPGHGVVGLGLLPVLLLIASPMLLAGQRAVAGPPLLALALGALALAVARRGRPLPCRLLTLGILGVHLFAAFRVQAQVGPEGDEPHYLMVADSLLRDHDLSLEQDYAEARYRPFYGHSLAPHYRVRGKAGEIFSLHAAGLSVLVLPAYAVGGYPAVSFFMAILGVLLILEIEGLVTESSGQPGLGQGIAALVSLTPPLLSYAGLVFTEVPAALCVAGLLRRGSRPRDKNAVAMAGLGLLLALLPWLNIRYAALSLLLALYVLAGRPRPAGLAALLAPLALSTLALAAHHFRLYGFYDPRLVYGRRPEFALATLREGLPGLLFDQEFGLLVHAPFLVLALPGSLVLFRRDRRKALAVASLVLVVLCTAGAWPMWRGGFNPPARFLVPVVPALALAAGFALSRGVSAGSGLLIGWSLWIGLAGACEPRLLHRDREGSAPFFRNFSGALEWTRLLPGYVLEDADRRRLTAVWLGALTLALLSRHRPASAPRLAVASLALVAAAELASRVGVGPTGGRDAVRVLGRPALELPKWNALRAATARWGTDALGWGPIYEPHRFPDGALLGSRLPLPAACYRLELATRNLAPGGPAPELVLRPEGEGLPRSAPLAPSGAGWSGRFDVASGQVAVTLKLRGGEPLRLEGIELWLQPSPCGPV